MQKFDKTFSSAWEKGFYIPTQDAERAKKRLFYNRKIGKKKKNFLLRELERHFWSNVSCGLNLLLGATINILS